MTSKNFNILNWTVCVVVTLIAAITYLSTLEPTASFWDCGEFIASSYKFEVGHPPGNPVFQLFARIFTIPCDASHAAVAVNALSGICSAMTIFFLYLTTVFFAKRLVPRKEDGGYSVAGAIAIVGAGALGALAYAFSDTFWFSAVEGEVYAMSSLFTALVLWAMTRWYEQADEAYANRWILLISFLMGLSIGIHLLNLLMIPAIVFLYYFRKREEGHYSLWQCVGITAIGFVLVGILNFLVIPYLPKVAAWFDLFFVNVLHCPFNTGAAFFLLALFTGLFWAAFKTLRSGKAMANTIIVCSIAILIGYSIFSICIIRSAAKTPTNEYQPDNPFTLVRYLSREQYGSVPLIYGQYFDSPYEVESTTYRAPLDGRYIITGGQPKVVYKPEGKMFFPRMHGTSKDQIEFYKAYISNGKAVKGASDRKPSFGDNLIFFFDYQINWMYWRYFMWNFAGRQNEIHSPSPGDIFRGNWESGITFLDEARLGDQSDAPDYLKNNRGKNHYYLLPLLLGLLGLCFQCGRDHRGCWINFLTFFMTGLAIVLYLNQTPYQVRERDYAYAGSFYAFSLWIGLAIPAVYAFAQQKLRGERVKAVFVGAVTLLFLGVPALMASENWDDHDRSGRRTAVEIAGNYLNTVGADGILVTHGDNDTFPLWYAQEVEGTRNDVRICNTSLLGTDWHIDQMKYACNNSAPLPLTVPLKQYLYGTNEYVYIVDSREQVIPISDVMRVFKHPSAKVTLSSGLKVDYIVSRRISIPVNKENALKYGIVPPSLADRMQDEIVITISKDKDYITKQELFMLDLLSSYQWDRPISLLGMGGDINIGIKEYLMYDGYSYRLVPFKTGSKRTNPGVVDPDVLYDLIMNRARYDAISADKYFIDYQNLYTFCGVINYREMFANLASVMNKAGRHDKAEEVLDRISGIMRDDRFPLNMDYLHLGNELAVCSMIDQYYKAGAKEKARELARKFTDEMFKSVSFYLQFYDYAQKDCENIITYICYLAQDIIDEGNGDKEFSKEIMDRLNAALPE